MKFFILFFVSSGLFASTNAHAIMEGNSAFGYRMTKITCCGDQPEESVPASGFEAQLGGHVDPFPILPMAIGGTIFYQKTADSDDLITITGWGIDIETKFWYPIPRVPFTLYVKGGYTFVGGYNITTGDTTDQFTPTGLVASGGLRLDILFRGAIFIQGTYRQTQLRRKQEKAKDTPVTVLGGVQIGI